MDIYRAIGALGVDLEYTGRLPAYRLGCYLDDERRILIRANLTRPLEMQTLHHEYVHALHRDRSTHPAVEWRAWREAARMIIDPAAYARAESMSTDSAWIARELGTTRRIVESFRKGIVRGEISLVAA